MGVWSLSHACTKTSGWVYVRVCARAYVGVRVWMYVHTYIYIHANLCVCDRAAASRR